MNTHTLPMTIRFGTDTHYSFFGYYDKCPYNNNNTKLLAHRIPPQDTDPQYGSTVEIGYHTLEEPETFICLATTKTWNWQQGAMLQWCEPQADDTILYNDMIGDDYGAIKLNIISGEETRFNQPIAAVSPAGGYFISYDYVRLAKAHPTIGYINLPWDNLPLHPQASGLTHVNLNTKAETLIFSYDDAANLSLHSTMKGAFHWFSHAAINPTGSRLLCLHRWTICVEDENQWYHRLLTMNPDGTDVCILHTSEHPLPPLQQDGTFTYAYEENLNQISHPVWLDDNRIMAWSTHETTSAYHIYRDHTSDNHCLNKCLNKNGHFTLSPNGDWLLSDTYPDADASQRQLFLYNMHNGDTLPLGEFYADPNLSKVSRCDLHPRWNRNGSQICIDSVHEGGRHMYQLDVSELTKQTT